MPRAKAQTKPNRGSGIKLGRPKKTKTKQKTEVQTPQLVAASSEPEPEPVVAVVAAAEAHVVVDVDDEDSATDQEGAHQARGTAGAAHFVGVTRAGMGNLNAVFGRGGYKRLLYEPAANEKISLEDVRLAQGQEQQLRQIVYMQQHSIARITVEKMNVQRLIDELTEETRLSEEAWRHEQLQRQQNTQAQGQFAIQVNTGDEDSDLEVLEVVIKKEHRSSSATAVPDLVVSPFGGRPAPVPVPNTVFCVRGTPTPAQAPSPIVYAPNPVFAVQTPFMLAPTMFVAAPRHVEENMQTVKQEVQSNAQGASVYSQALAQASPSPHKVENGIAPSSSATVDISMLMTPQTGMENETVRECQPSAAVNGLSDVNVDRPDIACGHQNTAQQPA